MSDPSATLPIAREAAPPQEAYGRLFLRFLRFGLLGHTFFERVVEHAGVRVFLDGVTAGVVGLIAVSSALIIWSARPSTLLQSLLALLLFALSLLVLYRWRSKLATLAVVLGSALTGFLVLWVTGAG